MYIQIYPWDELHVFLEDTIRIYRCILRCICIYTDVSVGWVYIQMYPWVTVSGHIHHPDIAPQGSETSASQTHFIPSPCSDNSLRLCRNTTMVTSHWLVLVNFATMMIGRFSLCLKNPAFLGFYIQSVTVKCSLMMQTGCLQNPPVKSFCLKLI